MPVSEAASLAVIQSYYYSSDNLMVSEYQTTGTLLVKQISEGQLKLSFLPKSSFWKRVEIHCSQYKACLIIANGQGKATRRLNTLHKHRIYLRKVNNFLKSHLVF